MSAPVHLYARVSTSEQEESGLGLAAQVERCRAYATAYGLEVATATHDACSGSTPPERRPALSAILAALRRCPGSGVLVVRLDRLTRSTRHLLELVDRSNREGWRLLSVSESLDTASPSGRLVVTILGAVAQMEREVIGVRTREALEVLGRERRRRSGRAPFGYRFGDGGALVLEPAEAECLTTMAAMRHEGHGARVIAGELARHGWPNPRTGRPWTTSTVHSILKTRERLARLGS